MNDKEYKYIEGRRIEDARLSRIEKIVNNMNAKINNGLSERSKATAKKVENLEKVVADHILEATTISHDITEIKDAIATLVQTQKSWVKMFTRSILFLLTALLAGIGWVLLNIDLLDKIMDHINSLV